MKKLTFPLLLATALVAASCTSDDVVTNEGTENGKNLIWFGSANDMPKSRAGFGASTRIVAQIVSEPRPGSDPSTAKYTKAVLTADADGTQSETTYSNVGYATGYSNKYWDDAHGRFSRLSVYAVAIPNQTTKSTGGTSTPIISDDKLSGSLTSWEAATEMKNIITWTVSAGQTATLLNEEDLTYSNNIQTTGDKGCYIWNGSDYPVGPANASKHTNLTAGTGSDGRLHFEQNGVNCDAAPTNAPGHFDKGQMEFKHALSRIQVNLKKGEGFEDADFNVTGILLRGQLVSGQFDIKTATWNNTGSATLINMAKIATGTNMNATYEAQMLPGYTFADDTNNAIELTVDGNTYYIMNKQLRVALKDKVTDNDYQTKMGTRYIFTLEVSKNKIDNITATIVDWNEVTAEGVTVDNSHLAFQFYDNNTPCSDVKLYKFEQGLTDIVTTDEDYEAAPTAGSAYTAVAGFTKVAGKDYYTTSEYYKDNKTAYHFRSVNTTSEGKLNADKTAFTMTSGNDDYHWGAPMNYGLTKIPYSSETGYSSSIAKGIVAASKESKINLTEIHMMSQLVIKLTTPETGGVDLTDAEVYLTKFSATGTVDMSLGKITPTATITTTSSKFSADGSAENTYVFNVVPQELKRNSGAADTDYVGITIKTKDNNEYYIIKRLSEIIATSVGSQVTNLLAENDKISTWYPGNRYTYTFNIKKKEIEVITATIVNWNDVKAGTTDLDLEK